MALVPSACSVLVQVRGHFWPRRTRVALRATHMWACCVMSRCRGRPPRFACAWSSSPSRTASFALALGILRAVHRLTASEIAAIFAVVATDRRVRPRVFPRDYC